MVSLVILVVVLIFTLVFMGWVLAFSARLAGSPRGRFRFGLAAMLGITLLNLLLLAIGNLFEGKQESPRTSLAVPILLLLAQVWLTFQTLRWIFQLQGKMAWIPFAGFVAGSIVQITFVLLFVRPFLTEAFVIPTRSMSPTLEPSDRVVANKVISPRRWDLIAYWSQQTRIDESQVFCKRLVGLPGETLRFEKGELFVNDHHIEAPTVFAGRLTVSVRPAPGSRFEYRDGQPIQLGKDEYFLIGDNVEISLDSRFQGPSKANSLIGVADLIYWPPAKVRIVR